MRQRKWLTFVSWHNLAPNAFKAQLKFRFRTAGFRRVQVHRYRRGRRCLSGPGRTLDFLVRRLLASDPVESTRPLVRCRFLPYNPPAHSGKISERVPTKRIRQVECALTNLAGVR